MDEKFRDQADGCHSAPAELANRSVSAPVRSPMVRFCTYCKEIAIRPTAIRAADAMIVYIYGEDRKAFWNGHELIVADGICEQCREKKFPETVQKGKTL
jgi:hypothetical protein